MGFIKQAQELVIGGGCVTLRISKNVIPLVYGGSYQWFFDTDWCSRQVMTGVKERPAGSLRRRKLEAQTDGKMLGETEVGRHCEQSSTNG